MENFWPKDVELTDVDMRWSSSFPIWLWQKAYLNSPSVQRSVCKPMYTYLHHDFKHTQWEAFRPLPWSQAKALSFWVNFFCVSCISKGIFTPRTPEWINALPPKQKQGYLLSGVLISEIRCLSCLNYIANKKENKKRK